MIASCKPPLAVELTDEQMAAIERLLRFEKPVATLGGFAGTGKTTVINRLAKQLPTFAVCAFTGKAANVLRRKGVGRATTIHQAIYKPVDVDDEEDEDEEGQSKQPQRRKRRAQVAFVLKTPRDVTASGFIVDEASMVTRQIYDDLRSYGRPLIFVGDHGQLEPVNGGNFNLMAAPDIVLEKVHRNAGEIAQFAEFVRQGHNPADWVRNKRATGEQVRFVTWSDVENLLGTRDVGQIIVAMNKTRVALNYAVRKRLGFSQNRVESGDRVMCLTNNHKLRVFNGMQGLVADVDWENEKLLFWAEGDEFQVKFLPSQFNSTAKLDPRDPALKGGLPFDYCYAVTCHKAQGDEWDSVLVVEERSPLWSHVRWAYTAASRARERLYWIPYNW